MKKRTWILIIVLVMGIIGLMIYLNQREKRPFDTFEFPETLYVGNFTENVKADTIAKVILHELLGYDTLVVTFYPMPGAFEESKEIEFVAFLMKVEFSEREYIVFLVDECSIGKLKMALCHEFIHLHQFETGELETLGEYGYVWKGDTVKYSEVEYEDRPYEIEAFQKGPKLERELNKILYK